MTEIYKVHINNREYTEWTFYNTKDFKEVILSIVPIEHKLFTNDTFTIPTKNIVNLIHSNVRSTTSIPCVLILKDSKTYGRHKNGKLLYKCVPDDMRLPTFMVPYEIKNVGFSKVFVNLYVAINFSEWTDKHPIGILSQLIGPVDILDNFYEYQLYCKSLNASIQKFNKDTTNAVKSTSHDTFIENISKQYSNIEDRTETSTWHIFTIDPTNSVDLDDAFSIKLLDSGQYLLSIYISNVTIWMDVLNLWESFSRRISTIYLPDRKRPMLPTILSDSLCSLISGNIRIAFVMDITIQVEPATAVTATTATAVTAVTIINAIEVVDIKYSNSKIRVFKNYNYEEPDLLKNPHYKMLLEITKKLSRKYNYINNIRNSHDLVCYLMIFMNYHSAKTLLSHNNGIFRSTIMKKEIVVPKNIPEDVGKFIKIWNSSTGQYIDASSLTIGQSISHELLEMDAYIHITSPIRRLVDLLNIIKFQQNTGLICLSKNAANFYDKWIADLDYINTTMRSIRKVQNDCSLLHLCLSSPPDLMDRLYDGYAFDKVVRNDGLFQFIVYLPELKLTSKVIMRENLDNYAIKKYKLYLFNDEEKFKKKIRLQLQETN
jgi:exoribonuclease R